MMHCPTCRRETETDTMPAHANTERWTNPQHIPARIFCAICGWFHGYDETTPEPEPEVEPESAEPLDWPVAVHNPPEFGRDSLPAVLDHYAAALMAWGSFWL
jgi:hypothetical protein